MSTTGGKKKERNKLMEAKKHASEYPTNHRRHENMHRNQLKWKHDKPKPIKLSKTVLRGMFRTIQAYLKKQEKK